MSTEKKEVVKNKKGNKLAKDKQNKVKLLSKTIYIVARILRVFTIIAAVFMLLAIVLTPAVIRNIKVEDNTISIFNMQVEYKYNENDGKIDLLVGDIILGSLSSDEKADFDIIIGELAKTDMTRSFAFIELALIAGVAVIFITYFILRYVDMLFLNIANNETPFTDENNDCISKIAYLSLISVMISLVSDIISSLFFGNSMVNVEFRKIIAVLVLYTIAYVFEYACILQKDSKNKMYEG